MIPSSASEDEFPFYIRRLRIAKARVVILVGKEIVYNYITCNILLQKICKTSYNVPTCQT